MLQPLSVLAVLQFVGIFAYAAAGAMAAKRKGLDLVGAIAVAFLTAFGGGSLRDVLLGRTPVFWVTHPADATLVFVTAALTFYLLHPSQQNQDKDTSSPPESAARHATRRAATARLISLLDALGLGVFGATGAAFSLRAGTAYLIAALMAVMTGTFGGVLRDVILNEIPGVFQQRTELYATCAFLGAWVYLLLNHFHVSDGIALAIGAIVISGLRLLAVTFHWQLPHPRG